MVNVTATDREVAELRGLGRGSLVIQRQNSENRRQIRKEVDKRQKTKQTANDRRGELRAGPSGIGISVPARPIGWGSATLLSQNPERPNMATVNLGAPGDGAASTVPVIRWANTTVLLVPHRGRPHSKMSEHRPRIEDEIDRARSGDGCALGELLERFREPLRHLSRRRMGAALSRRMDASDVVQQTFLEAHQSIGRFRGTSEAELLAWLRHILEFNLADAARKHLATGKRDAARETSLDDFNGGGGGFRRPLVSAHTSPSLRAVRLEQAAQFLESLELLPPDQREAVRLRHVEGWPLDRIAHHLQRSPEAAAGLLKRGLQALRARLRPRGEEHP
jgi:RNA polymerase sigma-70 factor (ECF subfamily)